MVKDSAYTDEQTKFSNKEDKLIELSNKDLTTNSNPFIVIDFGDGSQPSSELDPYEADSDELVLDLTED